ncbi:WD repeat-containing protein 46 [Gurleya vavrai]
MTRSERREEIKNIVEHAKRTKQDLEQLQILNTAQGGCLILEENENIFNITQDQIKANVNLLASEKAFELNLKRDKYFVKYDQTGRFTLTYGRNGYLSMFDTKTKNLHCENYLDENINDALFLHNELFMAVSQKKNVFIYDNAGREIHCLRKIKNIKSMKYLDYHFLLVNASFEGDLTFFDTSIGKEISKIETKESTSVLQKNQSNAIIFHGNNQGTVGLYSPNQKDYLVKTICHSSMIRNIEIDRQGIFMITSANDNVVKIWDLRNNYKPLNEIQVKNNFACMSLSQTNCLALGYKNKITVWKDFMNAKNENETFYLQDKISNSVVNNLEFCPFEDVLCVGHDLGIKNLIVPGSGDPNFDAFEYSPFRTKKQRQRNEINKLLEKIPFELINIDDKIGLNK